MPETPLVPGRQDVSLAWRQNDGMRLLFRTPEVNLGAASVNTRASIAMPADRWTLWLWGPRLGPAVLFWSLLTVSLLASIALGRVALTPLRARHWFLLRLGLTQEPLSISILIVAWMFALGWCKRRGATAPGAAFNLLQVALAAATLADTRSPDRFPHPMSNPRLTE